MSKSRAKAGRGDAASKPAAGVRRHGRAHRRPLWRGRWGVPLAIGFGLLIGLAVLALQGVHPAVRQAAQGGKPVAAAVPMTYWDGSRGTLADFQGKPLVLNFWASWCGSCLAELPRFEQVYLRHRDQVAFLGINLQDDARQADVLRQRTGITYRLARDPDGSVFRSLGGYAMPTTVLIGPDGRVRQTFSGELNAEQLEAAIQRYLLQAA